MLNAKAWILSFLRSAYIDYLTLARRNFHFLLNFLNLRNVRSGGVVLRTTFILFPQSFLGICDWLSFFLRLYLRDLERSCLSFFTPGKKKNVIANTRDYLWIRSEVPLNRIMSGIWNHISMENCWQAWNKHGPCFRVTAFVTAHFYYDKHERDVI